MILEGDGIKEQKKTTSYEDRGNEGQHEKERKRE